MKLIGIALLVFMLIGMTKIAMAECIVMEATADIIVPAIETAVSTGKDKTRALNPGLYFKSMKTSIFML